MKAARKQQEIKESREEREKDPEKQTMPYQPSVSLPAARQNYMYELYLL